MHESPCYPMCPIAALRHAQETIAVAKRSPLPQPTLIGVDDSDLGPKSQYIFLAQFHGICRFVSKLTHSFGFSTNVHLVEVVA